MTEFRRHGLDALQVRFVEDELERRRRQLALGSRLRRWLWIGAGIALALVIILLVWSELDKKLTDAMEVAGGAIALVFAAAIVWARREKAGAEILESEIGLMELQLKGMRAALEEGDASWRPASWQRYVLPIDLRTLREKRTRSKVSLAAGALATLGFLAWTFVLWRGVGFKLDADVASDALGAALIAAVAAIWAVNRWSRVQGLADEIRRREVELDLAQYEPASADEERAEKLFRLNQLELANYYRLNLNQNRVAFVIGIVCIGAGLAVAATTLMLLLQAPTLAGGAPVEATTQTLVAGIGAVSTIMVNVVGALFLRLHGLASRDLNQFHDRLVGTSDLFLANVIVARMQPGERQQATIARMALAMAERQRNRQAEPEPEAEKKAE